MAAAKEHEPLSPEATRVFEWIAGHVVRKTCFWYAEVKRHCNIASDQEVHAILEVLQDYPDRVKSHHRIVKAIYPEDQHEEGAFEVDPHADRAWAAYSEWMAEHCCPMCNKPSLQRVSVLRCQNPECDHEHDAPAAPSGPH